MENEKNVTLENEKPVTLGVRVRPDLFNKMEDVYRKWYVDKSKQLRCLLEYFLSLPEDKQKEIIDFGMQRELSSTNKKLYSTEGGTQRENSVSSVGSH